AVDRLLGSDLASADREAADSFTGFSRRTARIIRGLVHQHPNAPHPLALLRARPERPRRHAAQKRDELVAFHSITSSARAMSVGGTLMPSAFAVFILITNSNLVGCRIGKSAGFSPLRIRPT